MRFTIIVFLVAIVCQGVVGCGPGGDPSPPPGDDPTATLQPATPIGDDDASPGPSLTPTVTPAGDDDATLNSTPWTAPTPTPDANPTATPGLVPPPTPASTPPPDADVASIQELRDLAQPLEQGESMDVDLYVVDAIVTYVNENDKFYVQQRDGAGIFVFFEVDDAAMCGGLVVGDQAHVRVYRLQNYYEEIEISDLECDRRTATEQYVEPLDVSSTGLTQEILGQSVIATGVVDAIDGKLVTLEAAGGEILIFNESSSKLYGVDVSDVVTVEGPAIQYRERLEIKIDDASGTVTPEGPVETPPLVTPTPQNGSIGLLRELAAPLEFDEVLDVNMRVSGAVVTFVDATNHFYLQEPDDAGIYVYLSADDHCGGLSVGEMLEVQVAQLNNHYGERQITEMECLERTATGQTVSPVDVSQTGITEALLGRSASVGGMIQEIDGAKYRIIAYGNTIDVFDDASGKFAGHSVEDFVEITGPLVQFYDTLQFEIDAGMGTVVSGVPPDDDLDPYYWGLDLSQTGEAFKWDLHNLIDDHVVVFDAYEFFSWADLGVLGCPDDRIGDVYSSSCWIPWTEKCGQYNSEGDCYNQEHGWPVSWSDSSSPVEDDLHAKFPTDGFINSMRSNLGFGFVDTNATYGSSSNGCLWGESDESANLGFNGKVFEPADSVKGDLARALMYASVRYYTEDGSWASSTATDGASISAWEEGVFRTWHAADPVSQKELDRNEAIFQEQGNRNPFVDNPDWVALIDDF